MIIKINENMPARLACMLHNDYAAEVSNGWCEISVQNILKARKKGLERFFVISPAQYKTLNAVNDNVTAAV